MNIAINGFGRIGKTFLRTVLQDKQAAQKLTISTINVGPCSTDHLDTLFKYDTIMGVFPGKVVYKNNELHIDGHKIKIISENNPKNIQWDNIDWVVESSGCFTHRDGALLHIQSGAKKVLISAPGKNEDVTIIPGVNNSDYIPDKHSIVSIGSCTTNCFAPMIKVIKDNFDLQSCFMTTIHSYTNNQVLLDLEHHDPRRARAAALNIIPTSTGAQKVIIKLFPELEGKIHASALRVPTPVVSLIDLTFETSKNIDSEEINFAFKNAAASNLKGIVQYSEEPLVSSDYKGNPHSCILDSQLTQASGKIGKIFGWYDNEWGYSERLKDFLLHN